MNRWKDKLKQYEKESKPSFWKDHKMSIILSIALALALAISVIALTL